MVIQEKRTLHRDISQEGIVEILREDILNGVYQPGQQLKQVEIASLLNVSQGPVREALIHLVSDGIVQNIPYRGMFVCKLNKKDVQEIYQLRFALESLAVKLALPKLKQEEHFNKLIEYFNLNDKAEREGNKKLAVEMDLNFHRYIVELSENSRLVDYWRSLLAQSEYALRQLYENKSSDNEERLAKNHILILNVLRDGKYHEICEVLEEHMNKASQRLSQMIETNNSESSLQ